MIDASHLTADQSVAWNAYLATYLSEEPTLQSLRRAYGSAFKAQSMQIADKIGHLIEDCEDDTTALAWHDFQSSDELWAAGKPAHEINGVSRDWQ